MAGKGKFGKAADSTMPLDNGTNVGSENHHTDHAHHVDHVPAFMKHFDKGGQIVKPPHHMESVPEMHLHRGGKAHGGTASGQHHKGEHGIQMKGHTRGKMVP